MPSIRVSPPEYRCARKDCGRKATAYLYEANYVYHVCEPCYAVLARDGAVVSMLPPVSATSEFPANA